MAGTLYSQTPLPSPLTLLPPWDPVPSPSGPSPPPLELQVETPSSHSPFPDQVCHSCPLWACPRTWWRKPTRCQSCFSSGPRSAPKRWGRLLSSTLQLLASSAAAKTSNCHLQEPKVYQEARREQPSHCPWQGIRVPRTLEEIRGGQLRHEAKLRNQGKFTGPPPPNKATTESQPPERKHPKQLTIQPETARPQLAAFWTHRT